MFTNMSPTSVANTCNCAIPSGGNTQKCSTMSGKIHTNY